MPLDRVVRQRSQRGQIIVSRRILESADADMAGSDPREHRAWQQLLANNFLTGDGDREAAGGWNAERMHRFADDVFAQHRPERRATVAAPGITVSAGAFQLDVESPAIGSQVLA